MTKKRNGVRTCRPMTNLFNFSRRRTKIRLWILQDEVFFKKYNDLSDNQIRFYLGLRKAWKPRDGTAIVFEKWTARMGQPEFAAALKNIQHLVRSGCIVRKDALAIARRIRAQTPPASKPANEVHSIAMKPRKGVE